MTLTPGDQRVRLDNVGPVRVRITSYQLGDEFRCTIDNVDPGATIARGRGVTRAAAEAEALNVAQGAIGSD